jgi:hypothetical protein
MDHYMSLNNEGRINYAKSIVSKESIIDYQNAIGKKLSLVYNPKCKSIPGFAGQRKRETRLMITPPLDPFPGAPLPQVASPATYDLGIVREDGLHISTLSITQKQLELLAHDDFWILKKRDFN